MKKLLAFPVLIRLGLACVFLANSLTAFLAPDEFKELVSGSFLPSLLPLSAATFVLFIGANDLVVALLLLSGWRTSRVAAYATVWMIGVIAVIGVFTLDTLEHLGFLSMTVALMVRGETISTPSESVR